MVEEKMEIQLLNEGLNKLTEALKIFKDVESITEEDYEKLGDFTEKVNDILITKRVELRCIGGNLNE